MPVPADETVARNARRKFDAVIEPVLEGDEGLGLGARLIEFGKATKLRLDQARLHAGEERLDDVDRNGRGILARRQRRGHDENHSPVVVLNVEVPGRREKCDAADPFGTDQGAR